MKASLLLKVKKLSFFKPIAFADFSGFWTFLDFWQIFDQIVTTTTTIKLILFKTIWVVYVDKYVYELVLNIEASGAAILLKLWMKCQ